MGGGRPRKVGGAWGRWPWGLRGDPGPRPDINVILLTQVSEIHVLDSELPGIGHELVPDVVGFVWAELMSSATLLRWAPRQGRWTPP